MTPPNLNGTSRSYQAFWNTSIAEMLVRGRFRETQPWARSA